MNENGKDYGLLRYSNNYYRKSFIVQAALCGIQLKLKSIFGGTSFCLLASHLKSFSLLWMGSRHWCIWICGVCYVMEYEF